MLSWGGLIHEWGRDGNLQTDWGSFCSDTDVVPNLVELWVVTGSITLWIQMEEIQFLWRVPGFPLKNKVQTWVIWDSFRLDQKSYSWGGSNICLGCLVDDSLNRCLDHIKLGGDPKAQPGHAGDIISLGFPWKALDFPPKELKVVTRESLKTFI